MEHDKTTEDKDRTYNRNEVEGQDGQEVPVDDTDKDSGHASPTLQMSSTSSDYDTDLEDDVKDTSFKEESSREDLGICHLTYSEACEALGTVPLRKILDQLSTHEMRLPHVGMNANDSRALAYALWDNTRIQSLDLEDNGLDGEGLVPIINVFTHNIHITSLSLSENTIEEVGAAELEEVLKETEWLTHLNVSGTHMGDAEIRHIAAGIKHNKTLRWLNLSHNKVSNNGVKQLGRAIGESSSLQFLDLSWNHIRLEGAVALCKGIKMNKSLINTNLSWNGFGYEGAIALQELLKETTSLKVLDVSNNRINWEGVWYVAKGLKANSSLEILKIGNNPINMEGCFELMKAAASKRCRVMHVGLENVPVNKAVVLLADELASERPFTLVHGGLLDTRDIIGIKKEKPVDPVTLLVRYLAMIGMRIIDLFRMSDFSSSGHVTKEHFIRGLKRIGAPLGYSEMQLVAARLARNGKGYISYSGLSTGVRNQMREERMEDKKVEVKKMKKRDENRRILQMELPKLSSAIRRPDDLYMPMWTNSRASVSGQSRDSIPEGGTKRQSISALFPKLLQRKNSNFNIVSTNTTVTDDDSVSSSQDPANFQKFVKTMLFRRASQAKLGIADRQGKQFTSPRSQVLHTVIAETESETIEKLQ